MSDPKPPFPQDDTQPDDPAAPEQPDVAEPADVASPDDAVELDRLRDENRQLYEKLARAQADYQNSQRRLEKDADQRLKLAAGHLMREFLPVVDNLERALEVSDTADLQTVLGGVRGTYEQWMSVLRNNGVQAIAPEPGEPFEPERHEALMQEPVDPAPELPEVTRVLQKGYTFDGRVLRPAQVAVSRPA
jgi:molecular chaperone GrpE